MIFLKIYAVLIILDVLIIWLDIRKSKSIREKEGGKILKQIFKNKNETA